MLPVVQDYLTQSARRQIEPYYGFVEHAENGEIVTDLDFAPLQAVRVFAMALLRCGQHPAAMRGMKLQVLALRYDMNRGNHHPPRQSTRLVPYETLLAQRHADDVIVAPQNRLVMRGLVDGVRAVCTTYIRHLVRLELCGLPLSQVPEATTRLFDVLPRCDALRVLKLNKSTLKDRLFTRLTTSANSFVALKEAHFSECGLTDASARGIHSLILLNRGREQGTVWRASLRDGDGVHAALSLRALETLDFSGNRLGDVTLKRLGLAIAHDVSLRVVDLSCNVVTTAGLMEFLRHGALQNSAIESIDMSKNLIDSPVDLAVGEGFTCLRAHEQQLLLSRTERRGPCFMTIAAPHSGPRRPDVLHPKTLSTIVPAAVDAVGAPLEVRHSFACAADNSGGGGGGAGPSGDFAAGALDANVSAEGDAERETERETAPLSVVPIADGQSSTHCSVFGLPLETADRRSSSNRSRQTESRRYSDNPFSFTQRPGQQERQQLPPAPKHHHHDHHHHQHDHHHHQHNHHQHLHHQHHQHHYQAGMPFFPLPFFPLGGAQQQPQPPQQQEQPPQQWYGVPLYVPVPFSSFGSPAVAPPARPARNVAVGTSPKSDVANVSAAGSRPLTPCADGGHDAAVQERRVGADDSSALDMIMRGPARPGEWEISEWREKEQRFLQALVMRLESHESATTEMLERNYQATCDRLGAIQDEVSRWMCEVLSQQREECEKLRRELREELSARQRQSQDPEDAMVGQLAQLIHAGIEQIHDQMTRPATGAGTSAAVSGGTRETTCDYLREVRERLGSLGW